MLILWPTDAKGSEKEFCAYFYGYVIGALALPRSEKGSIGLDADEVEIVYIGFGLLGAGWKG